MYSMHSCLTLNIEYVTDMTFWALFVSNMYITLYGLPERQFNLFYLVTNKLLWNCKQWFLLNISIKTVFGCCWKLILYEFIASQIDDIFACQTKNLMNFAFCQFCFVTDFSLASDLEASTHNHHFRSWLLIRIIGY